MLSMRPVSRVVLIGGALAALQSAAAFAAGPEIPSAVLETPIAAVSDDGQLNEMLDTHNDVDESHNQVDQGMQEGAKEANNDAHEAMNDANEAKNDAQEAQQDANEATQEGSQHNSENNGLPPGPMGVNSGG
jgi:Skp family chaperone for outer membrane proteins